LNTCGQGIDAELLAGDVGQVELLDGQGRGEGLDAGDVGQVKLLDGQGRGEGLDAGDVCQRTEAMIPTEDLPNTSCPREEQR
jgi:hypothetical protein